MVVLGVLGARGSVVAALTFSHPNILICSVWIVLYQAQASSLAGGGGSFYFNTQ